MCSRKIITRIAAAATALILALNIAASCGPGRKIAYLNENKIRADLSLPTDRQLSELDTVIRKPHRDTLTVLDMDGNEVIIMNAIKDEDGQMVAHDVLDAAVVTARFRNVAERHGKVDLQFNITVPESLQDSKWQLRFYPDLFVMEDSLRLEPVIITGDEYRKAQLKGYEQYSRFISSIIQDTTRFINIRQLELFVERNIPALYSFKTDSTYVSDEDFQSVFGVTEQEAVEHYTNKLARSINRWKKSRISRMYDRYVKVPIVTEGIRLDTVLRAQNGDFTYCYTQTINTRPKLRKADVILSGEIYESDHRIYSMPETEPLTFYISSISAFVDDTERYKTKVIERRSEANTACYIDFSQGSSNIDETLGNNAIEMGRIKDNLRALVQNEKFDLDSITITAFASPEGTEEHNEGLCLRRARSASSYFSAFVNDVRDSLKSEQSVLIEIGENGEETISMARQERTDIRFTPHSGGENWRMLEKLITEDPDLSEEQKQEYAGIIDRIQDPDQRERAISSTEGYRHLREVLYPRLRVVKFNFFLHRKGMVKDTIHTTVLDTTYMDGVQAIRDRDYEKAIGILRPYNDFNTAVAFTALDYNASAMAILKDMPDSPQTEYLKAILYARAGDEEEAVQCFLNAANTDRTYFNRGNLDPEISVLIRTYSLDRQNEEEEEYYFKY